MSDFFQNYIDPFFNSFNYKLFSIGDKPVSLSTVLLALLLVMVMVYASGKAKRLLISRLLSHTKLDQGARDSIGTIFRYVLLFVGMLVVFQTIGIDLTALSVLTGAVGIGIGFGLQNIANNFISGLIILIERPIKMGDRVEVDDISGDVVAIRARSTYIRTNDNVTVIVPNSKFVSENVINLSYQNGTVRFKIPVSVAYDSDIDLVTKLLIEIANKNEDVASEPPPTVRLLRFDDSALYFELRAWSRVRLNRPGMFTSDINYEIVRRFRENGVEMPFPQRDIHVRTGNFDSGNVRHGYNEMNEAQIQSSAKFGS